MIEPGKPYHKHIRSMEMKDVQRVWEIDVASFSLPWPERSYRFEIEQNPASHCYVIEISQDEEPPVVAGMLVMWFILDEAHIGTIAIDNQFRRMGLGRCLLAEALMDAYQKGIRMTYLEVRRSNLAAQELYQQFGFVVAGIRNRYYKDNGEDALLMTLNPIDPVRLEHLRNNPLIVDTDK